MLKAKVNIQVFKVDRRLITLFKPFFRGKEIQSSEMSIFFKNFGPYCNLRIYGPQIDQSQGENRLSRIINELIALQHLMHHNISVLICRTIQYFVCIVISFKPFLSLGALFIISINYCNSKTEGYRKRLSFMGRI